MAQNKSAGWNDELRAKTPRQGVNLPTSSMLALPFLHTLLPASPLNLRRMWFGEEAHLGGQWDAMVSWLSPARDSVRLKCEAAQFFLDICPINSDYKPVRPKPYYLSYTGDRRSAIERISLSCLFCVLHQLNQRAFGNNIRLRWWFCYSN